MIEPNGGQIYFLYQILNKWRIRMTSNEINEELEEDPSYTVTLIPRITYTTLSGELKTEFEDNDVLALLLHEGIVFLNNHWWREDFTEEQKQLFSINVNVNDGFGYACADCEGIGYNELEDLFNYWEKDKDYGPLVFVAKKRKMLPLKSWCDKINKIGVWNIEKEVDILGTENPYGENNV